jgi:hypothetical protein
MSSELQAAEETVITSQSTPIDEDLLLKKVTWRIIPYIAW